MTHTRLIREDELELKVGDKVVSKHFPDTPHRSVESFEINSYGVKVRYNNRDWDWYFNLNKVVEKVVRTEEVVSLSNIKVEIPLEPGVFSPGDKVYFYFVEGYKGGRAAGPQFGVVESIRDGSAFLKGGRYLTDASKLHHEWELQEEPVFPFEYGERVWWKTAKSPNTPISEIRYDNVKSFMTNAYGQLVFVVFESGGNMSPEKVHHMWEPIS